MKSKKLWLGMLVLVLVFGMTVVGCEEDTEEEKFVTKIDITQITGKTGTASVSLWSTLANENGIVAAGEGTITGAPSNGTLAVSMKGTDGKDWDGQKDGGSYFIVLMFEGDDMYVYTNGQTFSSLGISSEDDLHKLPKSQVLLGGTYLFSNFVELATLDN